MGCDIHMYAEVLNTETVNKDEQAVKLNTDWEKVGNVFKNPYHDPKEMGKYGDAEEDDFYREFIDQPYKDRRYDLFSILADVRNGCGFAGVDTGDGFVPIAMPKGLPKDVSPEIKAMSDEWGCDGHSHSYFTVQEILDYDMSQKSVKRGYVGIEEFKTFIKTGEPEEWCGGVSGSMVEIISQDDMMNIVKGDYLVDPEKSYYCQVQWGVEYKDIVSYFMENTIPALLELGDADKVRIVFWFDN